MLITHQRDEKDQLDRFGLWIWLDSPFAGALLAVELASKLLLRKNAEIVTAFRCFSVAVGRNRRLLLRIVNIINYHDWNWRGNWLATIADDFAAQNHDHKVVDHGNEIGDQQDHLGFRIVITTTNTFFEIMQEVIIVS